MSAAVEPTPELLARVNLDDIVARIERQQAETRKFVAEREKLIAEREKMSVERDTARAEEKKLEAEAMKLSRDRVFAPWLILATLGSGLFSAVVASVVPLLLHSHLHQ